jgi:hypothetical protein
VSAQLCRLDSTIDSRFAEFHEANPYVFRGILTMLNQARMAGKARVGMKMIFEVLRWQHFLRTEHADDFLLNNDYSSRYSRLVMATHPELGALLEMRRLRAV